MTTTVTSQYKLTWPQLRRVAVYQNGELRAGDDQIESGVSNAGDNYVVRGDNFPDWKQRISRDESATTSLLGVVSGGFVADESVDVFFKRKIPLSPGFDEYTATLYGSVSRVGTLASPADGDDSLAAFTDSMAIQEFVARCLKAQRAMQSLVSFGEIGETLRMIRHPLSSLQRGLFSYLSSVSTRARGVKYVRKKVQRVVAETWLENAFGWQPLINDIKGAMDALSRLNTYAPLTKHINAKAGRSAVNSISEDFEVGALRVKVYRNASERTTVNVRYHGSIKVASAPTFTTDVLGLSLRDIVPSMWELIPYSFLVDYFTNVGSIIDSMSLRRSDLNWVERGTQIECIRAHKSARVTPLDNDNTFDYMGQISRLRDSYVSRKVVTREAYNGGFVPPLQFSIPGISSKKWLNIGALLLASKETSRRISRIG